MSCIARSTMTAMDTRIRVGVTNVGFQNIGHPHFIFTLILVHIIAIGEVTALIIATVVIMGMAVAVITTGTVITDVSFPLTTSVFTLVF